MKNILTIIIVFLLLLLITTVAIISYQKNFQSEPTPIFDNTEEVTKLLNEGRFDEAVDQLQFAVSEANSSQAQELTFTLADTKFMTGNTEQQEDAIKTIILSYKTAEEDESRAAAINKLLGYLSYSKAPVVYNTIFNSTEFNNLADVNYATSVKNLANLSLKYKETPSAYYRIAWWHADQALDISQNWNQTDTEKNTHIAQVKDILQNVVDLSGNSENLNSDPINLFWIASLNQVLMRVETENEEYVNKARQAVARLDELYQQLQTEEQSPQLYLRSTLPYAHLYFAHALYDTNENGKYDKEITEHLDRIIEVISDKPQIYGGTFMVSLKNSAQLNQNIKDMYIYFGTKSEGFSQLLQNIGVAISN